MTELPTIIPVLLGGILAIGGGVTAQILTHWLSARREKERLIREKAEELVCALYDHRDWLGRENSRLVFGSDFPETPSPLDKAFAIQEIYFSEVSAALSKINRALEPIVQHLYANAKARLEDKEKWIQTYDSEEFNKLYQGYLVAFHEAVSAVVSDAKRRTKI